MRRLLTSILACCYMLLSTGIGLHTHYCMGEAVSVTLIDVADDHFCSSCGMEKSPGDECCKDEHKLVKQTSEQLGAKILNWLKVQGAAEHIVPARTFVYTKVFLSAPPANVWRGCASPPPRGDCPIWLRTRNLRV